MKLFEKYGFAVLMLMFMIGLSGCALLTIPGQLIGGTFDLAGKLLGLMSRLPMPPPGVIPGVF